MSANVPHLRPVTDLSDVLCGEPIRGDTWQSLAGLANWINGHGTMIVPWYYPGHTTSNGSTDTYRFWVKPKAQTRQRIWVILARAASSGGQAEIVAPSGGTRTVWTLSTIRDSVQPIIFRETVTSSSSSQEITLDVKASGTGNVTVDAIACFEQTRASLELDTTNWGVDLESCRPRQPIVDLPNVSHPGVCDAHDNADGRRGSVLQWAVPTGNAAHTGSASYQALFETPVYALAPIHESTAAPMDYGVYAYVKATGGSIFVQATTAAGAVSASTSGTSFAWLTVGTVQIAAEDLTTADGIPGGGLDTIKIEAKCGTGTRVDIASVSVIRETLPL